MNKVDKLISIIHSLKEDGMGTGAIGGGPTNSTNQPEKPITVAGLPPDSPPVKRSKTYAKGGRGSRRWWLQFLNGK